MSDICEEDNIIILEEMLKVLKPIKLAVEALSRRNTNLLAADAIVFAL